jgi:uncharacterized protein Smg (DUF494 family)
MKSTVQNLVYVILMRLASSNGTVSLGEGLRSELQTAGYLDTDIEVAFAYLAERINGSKSVEASFPARRHLNFFEALKVNMEVLETLFKLEQMGLIDPMEREVLIEGFQHGDGPADIEDLEYALTVIIGPKRNNEAQNTLMAVSDGYIPTYH